MLRNLGHLSYTMLYALPVSLLSLIMSPTLTSYAIVSPNESNLEWQSSQSNSLIAKPNESSIDWYEKYWQNIRNEEGITFRLWKAYYDDRPLIGNATIRILGTTDRKPAPRVTCFLWRESDSHPLEIVKARTVRTHQIKHQHNHALQPVLVTCPTKGAIIPDSVSLSIDDGPTIYRRHVMEKILTYAPSNLLKIVKESRKVKKNFAVCSKWWNFDYDHSLRLIEWLEMVRILGADHVFLNILNIHPNMSLALDHYVSTGFVSLTYWSRPGNDSEENFRTYNNTGMDIMLTNEIIPIQDCLFKSIAKSFQYLAVFDLDEMIIPTRHYNWSELISYIDSFEEGERIDTYEAFRNYFIDHDTPKDELLIQSIPRYLHMMRHIYKIPHQRYKEIVNLDRCVSI